MLISPAMSTVGICGICVLTKFGFCSCVLPSNELISFSGWLRTANSSCSAAARAAFCACAVDIDVV